MRRSLLHARPLIYFLILALLSLSLPRRPAEANLVGTESAITPTHDAEAQRGRVRALFDRQDVQAHLEMYGISLEEARARVDSLTDDEVALIAGQLDQLPAGGAYEGAAALLLVATAVAVLVLIGVGVGLWHLGKWTVKKLSNASKENAP